MFSLPKPDFKGSNRHATLLRYEYKFLTIFLQAFTQTLLNLLVLILTVISLAFFGKAVIFYKQMLDTETYPSCAKHMKHSMFNVSEEYTDCLQASKNKAVLLCSIFGVLIVASLVELFVSFLLLVFLRKPLNRCRQWCIVDDHVTLAVAEHVSHS